MTYAPKTLLIAAAMVGLAGCAVDPVTDNMPAHGNGGPTFASSLDGPQNAKVIVTVAHSTERRGDLQTAVALYRRALSIDTHSYEAAMGLAEALSKLGVHDEAAEAWRIALKLRSDDQIKDTTALRGMGNTLVASGHPAQAVKYFEQALMVKPEPRLYNSMGVAHDMLNDYKAAQAYYRVGLESDAQNLTLLNNLGLSYLLSGKVKEAVTELKRAADLPNAGMKNRMNLALALVQAGSSDAALSIARMDLGPSEANQQIAYFETIRAIGDTESARKAIQAHIRGSLDQKHGGKIVRPSEGMVGAR